MKLREKQSIFAFLVARLLIFMHQEGYEFTFGDAYRSPEEAARLARLGKGIKDSLHTKRLAIDINLFKNGKYLTSTESHKMFGDWWEHQHKNCRWGGKYNDGNHYEFLESSRKIET